MKALEPFLKKYGWRYLPGILFLFLSSWIQTRSPLALGEAVDLLSHENPIWEKVLHQAWLILLIAVGVFITRFIWRYFIIGNARNCELTLREELFKKYQSLPLSFFYKNKSGDLMAYAINDINAIRMTFGPAISMTLTGIGTCLFSLFSMGKTVPGMLLLYVIIPLPFAMSAVLFIGKIIRQRFGKVQRLFASISGYIQESIAGMRTLKAFAREEDQIKAFEPENNAMRDANISLTYASSLMNPFIQIIFGASFMISIGLGGGMVASGQITLGDFVAFSSYLTMMMFPVISIGRISNIMQRGFASVKRFNDIFRIPSIPTFELGEAKEPVQGDIIVKNLSFSYGESLPIVLNDISFALPQGKVLGIVGPTGSGKSTIISLLTKEFPSPENTIWFGNQEIHTIPARALREEMGVVPQDSFLFSTSIKENILFYQPGAGNQEMLQAAHIAGLDRDLAQFSQGWDTIVGERGSHLSGGQQQRVSIARALIRKPRYLFLDDCLSAVDTKTENAILTNLKENLQSTTAIIVTHRLSAVLDADEILYLDEGRITERGSHAELMALGGAYADLFRQQSESNLGGHDGKA